MRKKEMIMVESIRLLKPDEKAYRNLALACEMFKVQNPDMGFEISNGYYDLGADWQWTSITAIRKKGDRFSSFWALNPRAHGQIVNAENVVDIALAVRDSNPDNTGRDYSLPERKIRVTQKLVHRIYTSETDDAAVIEKFKTFGADIWLEDETEYSIEED